MNVKVETDQERIARTGAQPGYQGTPGIRNQGQPDPSTLSGQQIQVLAKNHADALAAIKRDVELRKWAVDQAVGLFGSQAEAANEILEWEPVALARKIHAFLVEGAEKSN